MPKIFISYRRNDTAGHVGWLRECLKEKFGNDVLTDISAIELGENFEETLRRLLYSVDIALIMIGPRWAGARDEHGELRLFQPHDYVRLEILEVLKRKVLVIPTLVWGATMPRPTEVPEELRELLFRQAVVLSDRNWKEDVDQLKKVLVARTFNIPPASGDMTISLKHLRQLLREAPPEAHADLRFEYVASKARAAGAAAFLGLLCAFAITFLLAQIDSFGDFGWFNLSDRYNDFAFQMLTFLILSVVDFFVISGWWWRRSVQRRRAALEVLDAS